MQIMHIVRTYYNTCFLIYHIHDVRIQGRSHDSLSGQVEFVPSLSDLHFRIRPLQLNLMFLGLKLVRCRVGMSVK